MGKLLVSACLLGDPVRYDGQAKAFESTELHDLVEQNRVITFCPEVAGGLPVPRPAAEIQQGDGSSVIDGLARIITINNDDVTEYFIRGARQALDLCLQHRISVAILTEYSPSCGSNQIYDGSLNRTRHDGIGVTTALLQKHGVRVFSQYQVNAAISNFYDNN